MNSNRSPSAKGSSSDHLLASIGHASSLKRLFKDVITPADRAVLSQYLRELEIDITRHDAEIQRLRAATYAAESRHRQLKNAFEMYSSLLAPIHRLPAEILHYIFSLCCDDLSILWGLQGELQVPTLVILTMVCSRWRELAISSSNLWAAIQFGHYSGSEEPHENGHRLNRMTQLFMARARNSPLRITFCVAQEEEGGLVQDPGFSLALDALCRRSNQWRHVEFEGYTYDHPALALIRGNLSNLQFLGYKEPQRMDEASELALLGPCPALRSMRLCLYLPERPFRENILEVPWHQLETLSLKLFPDTPSPLQILDRCPNLKNMTIDSYQGFDTPDRDFEGHIVSNLHHLSIDMHPGSMTYVPFLEHVTLPQLSSLDLYGIRQPRGSGCDEQPILDFFRRSSFPLTSLSLRYPNLSDDQVVRLLRAVPSLRTLHIEEGFDHSIDDPHPEDPPTAETRPMPNVLCTSNLFKRLLVDIIGPASAADSSFLPHLEKLDVAVHGKTVDSEAFAKAMISRWIPDPGLSARLGIDSICEVKVKFVDSAPEMPEGLERLRLFRSEGLRVELPEV
ncbi:hypothetical protein V5O48_008667 [Marasmius crinis-equi]|uniref:F-box domain-containing protein n=1 Tax=Marasmius crinis-equi TaxID=585013 RepID=A0ABR3FDD2_9AGAR